MTVRNTYGNAPSPATNSFPCRRCLMLFHNKQVRGRQPSFQALPWLGASSIHPSIHPFSRPPWTHTQRPLLTLWWCGPVPAAARRSAGTPARAAWAPSPPSRRRPSSRRLWARPPCPPPPPRTWPTAPAGASPGTPPPRPCSDHRHRVLTGVCVLCCLLLLIEQLVPEQGPVLVVAPAAARQQAHVRGHGLHRGGERVKRAR